MKKNLFKRIAAIALAGTMMLAMGTTAFAVDQAPDEPTTVGTTFTFKKYLVMDKDANVPDAEFSFSIAPGDEVVAGQDQNEILVGIGSPAITTTADFNPSDTTYDSAQTGDNVSLAANQKYAKKDITVDFTNVHFEDPGIYRYLITESGTNDGVMNDSNPVRTLDVYVVNDEDGLKIDGFVFYYVNNGNMVKTDYVNTYTTKNVTVAKLVTGNQGDMNKEFAFTIAITNADANTVYNVVKTNQNANPTDSTATVASDGKVDITVNLKNGECITIYGLTDATEYTVTETSYATNGYTTKWDDVTAEEYDTANATEANTTGTLTVDTTQNVTFENNKQVTTPTGIITNVLPYVLMAAAALALAFVFLRKREYDR